MGFVEQGLTSSLRSSFTDGDIGGFHKRLLINLVVYCG